MKHDVLFAGMRLRRVSCLLRYVYVQSVKLNRLATYYGSNEKDRAHISIYKESGNVNMAAVYKPVPNFFASRSLQNESSQNYLLGV